MTKPRVKMLGVYLLGLALGVGAWVLSAGPGTAAGVFEITQTTSPGLYVKLIEPMRATHKLEIVWTLGSDTKARANLVAK